MSRLKWVVFLMEQEGKTLFDLDALDRILRCMPADASDQPDEYFDEKTGRLKLRHMREYATFTGIQKKIISILWKARNGPPLGWDQIKREAGSAVSGIARAFGRNQPWTDWIERVEYGRYRIRAGHSPH
ncbi:hypothetical protein CCP4SC76_1330002 [Gammaproteobacteria bacterium]